MTSASGRDDGDRSESRAPWDRPSTFVRWCAFAHRERKYFVSIINVWLDPTEDSAPHQQWTESLWDKIKGEGNGVYVNFLEREGANRIRQAYPGSTYERLVDVKTAYDPENLFRFNQNIAPRA